MSDHKEAKKATRRYLGKMRGTNGKYGPMYKIYMDNINPQKENGEPNPFCKGMLLWVDSETGKTYQVKQMSLFIPKDGMDPKLVEKGYSHFITLNLDDDYEVTVVG